MQKEFLMAFSALTLIIGCNKSESGNKDSVTSDTKVITDKNIDGRNINTESIPYKGLDGSRARAIFVNTDKANTITIEANDNKFQLDRKELTAAGAKYERNGIAAELKGDSLIITQDKNVIPLVKAK